MPGSSKRRLTELHIVEARRCALQLSAYSTGVFPKEWDKTLAEEVTITLSNFASHAYRINELCDINADTPINGAAEFPYKFSVCPIESIEENYCFALNCIRHAQSYVFGWTQIEHRKLYLHSTPNLAPTYVEITTNMPKFGTRTISIFGISHSFLTSILPLIRKKYPDYRF